MTRKIAGILLALFIAQFSFSQTQDELWKQVNDRPYPQWFKDAKLGIFIHWGLYSVPSIASKEGYAEWYLRGLMTNAPSRVEFQKKIYGENFTYRDFAPLFKAELWNPDEWAELFKNSGAKYIVFVSKHHDGYALWPSKYSPGWNSVETGPKRDLVGELSESVRKTGLKMGLYYSLPEWNNELHLWDTDPHRNITRYVNEHMIPQFKELVSTYKPSVIFADGEWWNTAEEWHSAELISWYYNEVGSDAIVNNRWGHGSDTGFLTPEYSAGISETNRPWAECRGLGRSFGLNRNEKLEAYMSPEELIHFFIKAVANGGGIILNVGPKADGQIPLLQQERLMQLGSWLQVNGEAIYGTEAWSKTGEEKPTKLERIDKQIDFNWVRNTPVEPIKEDHFTAEWTGFIQPENTGKHHFEVEADDGMRVWINDSLVVNQWEKNEGNADGNVMENKLAVTKQGDIFLQKGKKYTIKVDYFETQQNAQAKLFWSATGMEKQIVPQKNLFTEAGLTEGNGLNAVYRSQKQYMAYTTKDGNVYAHILEWPGSTLRIPLDAKPGKNLKVSMLGLDGTLDWKYQKGHLIIDLSKIGYNEMPCQYAWCFKLEGLN